MILFFDVESSGLFREGLPVYDPTQPHLVEIGARLLDSKYQTKGFIETMIQPTGWSVEPEALVVHGISEADCARYGIDIRAALSVFQQMCLKARFIVAHNLEFDRKVIAAQLAKIGSDGLWWQRQAPKFKCTMEESKEVCRLPGQYGDFKFPSLAEAFCHFNPGVPFETTHRAGADIAACISIYRALEGLHVENRTS